MCTIWTPEQWLENSQRDSAYTLLDTRYNQTGDVARTYSDTYGRVYAVVSTEDQPRFTPAYYDAPRASALDYLTANGYALSERPSTQDVVVQGRTLAQWAEEGRLNETRNEHVHPVPPSREELDAMSDQERNNLILAKDASNTQTEKDYMDAVFGRGFIAAMLAGPEPATV